MPYSTLLIDLDGTLYPQNNGIWEEIAARMEKYMHDELNLPKTEIPGLRKEYYRIYGTTLSGLRKNYHVNEVEFLNYVHDVPIHQYLSPDLKLREMLNGLPQKKWVFTNSDKGHAQRVLNALDITDLFEGILDITHFNYLNKPNNLTYKQALMSIGEPDPYSCMFVDDSPANLPPARDLGLTTVLVGNQTANSGTDYHISSIYELPSILVAAEGD